MYLSTALYIYYMLLYVQIAEVSWEDCVLTRGSSISAFLVVRLIDKQLPIYWESGKEGEPISLCGQAVVNSLKPWQTFPVSNYVIFPSLVGYL